MMSDTPVPWLGLAGLIAMFVIPFLPNWLFEGPRTVKHWPQRHVCGGCGAPWAKGHLCTDDEEEPGERVTVPEVIQPAAPLRGEVRRLKPTRALERSTEVRVSR
jgi:hypothetical protein